MRRCGTEVAVIGGGVIGTSIAYQLAKRGIAVTLFESKDVGAGTSSAAVMGVQMQTKTLGPKLSLALQSLAAYQDLEAELGQDLEFESEGSMIVAETPVEAEYVEQRVAELRAKGLEIHFLDSNEARAHQRALGEHICGASYCPVDSVVSPLRLVLAFAERARQLGAQIRTYTSITDITLRNGRVSEVVTPQGPIGVEAVVVACGVWTPAIAQMVGLDVPVVPRRGQIFVTEPAPPFMKGMVMAAQYLMSKTVVSPNKEDDETEASALLAGTVAYQTRYGNVLIGSTREYVGFNREVTYDGLQKLIKGTIHLLPMMRHLSMIRAFTGLRPATPDGLPIIERSSEITNLYLATGHEGDGIALSPITGIHIAELIAGGDNAKALLPFSSHRFDEE